MRIRRQEQEAVAEAVHSIARTSSSGSAAFRAESFRLSGRCFFDFVRGASLSELFATTESQRLSTQTAAKPPRHFQVD